MKKTLLMTFLLLAVAFQPACFLKFWGKEKDPTERIYDVYGTVQEISREKLVITHKGSGSMEFAILDSSIKGSDFKQGAFVHVYYKQKEGQRQVTMVVEKID